MINSLNYEHWTDKQKYFYVILEIVHESGTPVLDGIEPATGQATGNNDMFCFLNIFFVGQKRQF